ncbi:MAG: hypothetical protein R3A48_21575 [Polyangiales bacterium]
MMRKIAVSWSPSPVLAALGTLGARRRRGRGPALVHDELRRELLRALSAFDASMAGFASCLAWLDARGAVKLGRPVGAESSALSSCLRGGELQLDLTKLEAAAADETRGVEGRSHSTLYALRATLRALAREELFTVSHAKAGARRASIDEILREVERVAKRCGFRSDDTVPARFAPRVEKTVEAPVAPRPAKKAPRVRAAKKAPTGFGGLPDDAVSEAPEPEASATPTVRGPDADFFLAAAGLTAWPCPRETLDRARRAVLSRLHPDRTGDDSARDFRRAHKGYQELIQLLELLPPVEAPPVEERPAPVEKKRRAPRSTAARAVTAPTVPPRPVAVEATVHEWPPRAFTPQPAKPAPLKPDADAEFFLREAGLTWPCDAQTLETAWGALSARLRRVTPASAGATAHAQASRGYAALRRAAPARGATP